MRRISLLIVALVAVWSTVAPRTSLEAAPPNKDHFASPAWVVLARCPQRSSNGRYRKTQHKKAELAAQLRSTR